MDPFSIPVYDKKNNNHNNNNTSNSSNNNNSSSSSSSAVINQSSPETSKSSVNDPYKHFVPLLVIPSEEGNIFYVTIILIM